MIEKILGLSTAARRTCFNGHSEDVETNAVFTGLKNNVHGLLLPNNNLSPCHRVVGSRYALGHALSPGLVPGKRLPYELQSLVFPAAND